MSDKTVDAFSGFFQTMSVMKDVALGGTVPGREDVLRDEWDDLVVDTCAAFDTGEWETGIKRGGDSFKIAEQYEDRDAAVVGHAKWGRRDEGRPEARHPRPRVLGLRPNDTGRWLECQ